MTDQELAELEAQVAALEADCDTKERTYRDALLALHPVKERLRAARDDAMLEAQVAARLADRIAAERRGQEAA